jgi:hypothetical protein
LVFHYYLISLEKKQKKISRAFMLLISTRETENDGCLRKITIYLRDTNGVFSQ